eukprot:CAMPEP_0196143616 /NCGR_PEP_ID=MMETSP0910-20130528/13625_1 /TAXON_ID=49265 /ORGANISM="Thalassiosira rotula, Strain GSO102" /LENGTH=409 /DNA_ID=CAMNT_0041405099 /DNA_START=153 /DNA_END=1382 /DNA_ORIENTATION=+
MKMKQLPHANDQIGQSAQSSPLLSRIFSGSIGCIIYHVGFTPLEVVKVRQQAATTAAANVSSPIQSSPSPVKAFHRGRGLVMLNNGLKLPANAFPCLVAPQYRVSLKANNICARLFESVPVAHNTIQHSNSGIIRSLIYISRYEGRAGLYAGLRPTLLAAVPNTAIYFTAYDEITSWLRKNHAASTATANGNSSSDDDGFDARQKLYFPLVAGATARLFASVATAPIELIRIRQAASSNNSQNNGVLEEFLFVLRNQGPLGLYRGLSAMIIRDVPFSALYFLGLETFKSIMSESSQLGSWGVHHYRENGMKPPASVEVLQSFVSGAASGAIAVVLTTPFDLVKTRRQVASQREGVKQSTFGYMRQIVQEEGLFAGLWRGNVIRMIKVAPGTAIMISCYEFGKRFFEGVM